MIVIDHPADRVIIGAYDWIEGWFACDDKAGFSARINNVPHKLYEVERLDMPDEPVMGFRVYINLWDIIRNNESGIILEVLRENEPYERISLQLHDSANENAKVELSARPMRKRWIERHYACARCRSGASLIPLHEGYRCRACQTVYPTSATGLVNWIDPHTGLSGSVADKKDPISANYYDHRFHAMFDSVRPDNEEMILDVGAGFRRLARPNVIPIDIYDYPSTDIIATADAIPLQDGCASVVYHCAVLEHVPNPFACASEILRVLKPGGVLISGIPFMQPEHGYPGHYFNATRSGHLELYKDHIEIVDFYIDDISHPWFSIMWILNEYRQGLPVDMRDVFDRLTVSEILGRPFRDMVGEPIFQRLSDQARWRIASGTMLVGRKKP